MKSIRLKILSCLPVFLLLTAGLLAQAHAPETLKIPLQDLASQQKYPIRLLDIPFVLSLTDMDKNGSVTDAGVDIVSLANTLTNQSVGDFTDVFDSFYVRKTLFVFKAGPEFITLTNTAKTHPDTPVGQNTVYENLLDAPLRSAVKTNASATLAGDLTPGNVQDSLLYFFFSFEGCGGCIQNIPYLRELRRYKVKLIVCHAKEPDEPADDILESIRTHQIPGSHYTLPDASVRNSGISHYPAGVLCRSNGDVIRYVAPRRLLNLLSRQQNGSLPPGATPDSLHVLFIGNSLTYYNDLDRVFSGIATAQQIPVGAEKICFSGFSLRDHIETTVTDGATANREVTLFGEDVQTLKKGDVSRTVRQIQRGTWDCIVLQGVLPYEENLRQSLATLDSVAHRYNPGCTVLLLQNYVPVLWSDSVRTSKLQAIDGQIAEALPPGMAVAPVGELFGFLNTHYPDLELFPDDEHPSPAGTRMMAEMILAEILRNLPGDRAFPPRKALFSAGIDNFYKNRMKR